MDLLEVPTSPFQRHPWEVARARFFRNLLKRAGAFDSPVTVLDVGAGDGYLSAMLLEEMAEGSRVTCLDPNYTDEQMIRFGTNLGVAATFSRTRPPGTFDIVLLLDVLEHVAADRDFLARCVTENVRSGGVVLVSVPAWQFVFTQHDVALKHLRRYSAGGLRRLAEQAGLTIVGSGGLFHALLIARALTALREARSRRLGRPRAPTYNLGNWSAAPLASKIIGAVLSADNFLSEKMAARGASLPGLSCWVLCRKTSPG